MKHIKTQITFCLLLITSLAFAQKDLYKEKIHIKGKDTLKYRIMYPENFSKDKKYPVVLFLHGAGERGSDNQKQLTHGSKLFLDKMNRGAFPSIVIFPQCPKEDYWANANVDRSSYPLNITFPENEAPTTALSLVMNLMDDMVKKPYVQTDKVYVGGLSMGGMGTFEILYRKPDMFAAAFAICGGGNPDTVTSFAKKVPMWVFHGAKDDVVTPQHSVTMVNAILNAGGTPNFTLYADDNHNSWDSTFAEPELLTWLFSNTKTNE
ncbi:prolyl oligopeptidase family serine peptidase [Mesoflavibacter sp. CH_XMU1422-2]|uniref:carboxylesterase family protein n=1 Tax=Mesoflavibacter sp. CH_XMU1422-2 TaxID=3107770 RepID=UPI003009BC7B